jgi:DNA-binding PadR family transcriptional regulator
MSVKFAILGYLSHEPQSGYDVKKKFQESETVYWSGSNNQIYRSLVQLHEEGLVTRTVEHQEDLPDRKVYSITDKGLAALKEWVQSPPELAERKHAFLVQLMWADLLTPAELETLMNEYEEEVRVKLLMLQEQDRRRPERVNARTEREAFLWLMITRNWLATYVAELDWLRQLREGLEQP